LDRSTAHYDRLTRIVVRDKNAIMKKSKKKVIKHRNEREIEKQKHLRNNRNKQHFTNEDFVVLCVCVEDRRVQEITI